MRKQKKQHSISYTVENDRLGYTLLTEYTPIRKYAGDFIIPLLSKITLQKLLRTLKSDYFLLEQGIKTG